MIKNLMKCSILSCYYFFISSNLRNNSAQVYILPEATSTTYKPPITKHKYIKRLAGQKEEFLKKTNISSFCSNEREAAGKISWRDRFAEPSVQACSLPIRQTNAAKSIKRSRLALFSRARTYYTVLSVHSSHSS